MSALELDIRFILAFLAPSIAFGFWFVRRWFEDRRKQEELEKRKTNLIRALYAEIDFITADFEKFCENSPSVANLRKALIDNPDLVPHVTNSNLKIFYSNLNKELHLLPTNIMADIICFYNVSEKINTQVEGMNLMSFRTLGSEGKLNAVVVLLNTAHDGVWIGRKVLKSFELEFEPLNLVRFDRFSSESNEVLVHRMSELKRRLQNFHEVN